MRKEVAQRVSVVLLSVARRSAVGSGAVTSNKEVGTKRLRVSSVCLSTSNLAESEVEQLIRGAESWALCRKAEAPVSLSLSLGKYKEPVEEREAHSDKRSGRRCGVTLWLFKRKGALYSQEHPLGKQGGAWPAVGDVGIRSRRHNELLLLLQLLFVQWEKELRHVGDGIFC